MNISTMSRAMAAPAVSRSWRVGHNQDRVRSTSLADRYHAVDFDEGLRLMEIDGTAPSIRSGDGPRYGNSRKVQNLAVALASEGIRMNATSAYRFQAVTHYEVSADEIDRTVGAVGDVLQASSQFDACWSR